ncbi:MAG: baeRF10 domain-containing protein [bacterium]
MITHRQVEDLMNFDGGAYPVVSLYLRVGGGDITKKDYEINLKDLMKECEGISGDSRLSRKHLTKDLDRIQRFVTLDFQRGGEEGLAVFSCSGKDFWQVYRLPRRVKDSITVESHPYIRPLMALLDRYHRYCVALVDRSRARIFEFYAGEIEERTEFFEESPGKVRAGGWSGYEERRISRHIEDHAHRHFKRVADLMFKIFQRDKFDWLILGGHKEVIPEFEGPLHSYLKERIVDRIFVDLEIPLKDILDKTSGIERRIAKREGDELVGHLLSEVNSGGLGVVGLKETLGALREQRVQTLIIGSESPRPGSICGGCGYLGTGEEFCPRCGGEMSPVPDIVEEAVESAIRQNCNIRFVEEDARLEERGGIGALLRFKI